MTGLERVLAAVQGTTPDRPAVSMTLSLYGAKLIEAPLKDYYTCGDLYAQGQQAVGETFDADILFTPFTLASIGEAFGSQIAYYHNQPPNVAVPGCTDPFKIAKMASDTVFLENSLVYHLEATSLMAAQNKGEAAIGGIFLSPVDLPPLVMGMEAWLHMLLFEEKEAKMVLEAMTQYFVSTANRFFEAGAHLLVLPLAFCNPNIVTRGMVEKVVVPVLRGAFRQVKGPIVLHHVGLPLSPFLQPLKGLPNVAGYALDSRDSFDEARDTLGEAPVLLGNVDGPTLYCQTPESITARCRSIYDNRRADRHFILATSSADIPLQTPIENIRALVDSTKAYGEDLSHE